MKLNQTGLRAISAVFLALVFAISAFVPSFAAAKPEVQDEPGVSASIYPTPQSVTAGDDDGMLFEGTIDLVVKDESSKASMLKNRAIKILEENGIEYREADEADPDNASLIISSDPADYAEQDDALEHEQGYVLVSSDNGCANVTIVGNGADGAWNGLMTFEQMLDQKTSDGRFAKLTVSDYPDIEIRGVVEGFYGLPWTNEQRVKMVEDASKYKMNMYVYAPKDDPYHSAKWNEEYPADKAEELKELVKACEENNITFCWNAHLRTGFASGGRADTWAEGYSIDTLNAKFESMYELGVRRFGISYDDIGNTAASENVGAFHGTVIAQAYEALTENHPGEIDPMIVVADRYTYGWGAPLATYFTAFMNAVPEDTYVMWTGDNTGGVISNAGFDLKNEGYYTGSNAADYMGGVKNYPVAWLNYPVNDMEYGRLHIGPMEPIKEETVNISGLLLNPMTQAEASRVAIYSGADYAWNMEGFDGSVAEGSKIMESWKRAISELVGEELSEPFARFADNIGGMKFESVSVSESKMMKPFLDAFDEALESGEDMTEHIAAVKAKFQEMIDDSLKLQDGLPEANAELWAEIEAFVRAYGALGELGVIIMDEYEAVLSHDVNMVELKRDEYYEKLRELRTKYTIKNYPSNRNNTNLISYTAEVGTVVIRPWIDNLHVMIRNMDIPPADEPLMGDVNLNGGIDAGDATLILRDVVGVKELSPEERAVADMNNNQEVDAGDATIVLRIAVGLES